MKSKKERKKKSKKKCFDHDKKYVKRGFIVKNIRLFLKQTNKQTDNNNKIFIFICPDKETFFIWLKINCKQICRVNEQNTKSKKRYMCNAIIKQKTAIIQSA